VQQLQLERGGVVFFLDNPDSVSVIDHAYPHTMSEDLANDSVKEEVLVCTADVEDLMLKPCVPMVSLHGVVLLEDNMNSTFHHGHVSMPPLSFPDMMNN
jgi:hypothetical protein